MKLLISIFFVLAGAQLQGQHSLYDLSVESSSGKFINLADYKGKRLLIVVANPAALKTETAVRYLGKIQAEYPQLSLLVLWSTTNVESSSFDAKALPELDNTSFSTKIINQNDSSHQHPILQWLTDLRNNQHFDKKIVSDEQFYVISESGVLYAVLEKGVSDIFLNEALTAKEVKPQDVITEANR